MTQDLIHTIGEDAPILMVPIVGQEDTLESLGSLLLEIPTQFGGQIGASFGGIELSESLFSLFFIILWILDLNGLYSEDNGFLGILDKINKFDWIGIPTRIGFHLAHAISTSQGADFIN